MRKTNQAKDWDKMVQQARLQTERHWRTVQERVQDEIEQTMQRNAFYLDRQRQAMARVIVAERKSQVAAVQQQNRVHMLYSSEEEGDGSDDDDKDNGNNNNCNNGNQSTNPNPNSVSTDRDGNGKTVKDKIADDCDASANGETGEDDIVQSILIESGLSIARLSPLKRPKPRRVSGSIYPTWSKPHGFGNNSKQNQASDCNKKAQSAAPSAHAKDNSSENIPDVSDGGSNSNGEDIDLSCLEGPSGHGSSATNENVESESESEDDLVPVLAAVWGETSPFGKLCNERGLRLAELDNIHRASTCMYNHCGSVAVFLVFLFLVFVCLLLVIVLFIVILYQTTTITMGTTMIMMVVISLRMHEQRLQSSDVCLYLLLVQQQ